MESSDKILKRQKFRIHFKNEDMDFIFNWMLGYGSLTGLSHGELFYLATQIEDGSPDSWQTAFHRHGQFHMKQAEGHLKSNNTKNAGNNFVSAAQSFRASLQFISPRNNQFKQRIDQLEHSFQQYIKYHELPVESVEIPFEDGSLPGYFLKIDERERSTLLVIGGGDTFREDLYFFDGIGGFARGYNVVMIDLPGQGKTPFSKLYFRPDAEIPIAKVIDWLLQQPTTDKERIAVYGLSSGGYFSARAAAFDKRIKAWVASTPIYSLPLLFEREMPKALRKSPGWLANFLVKIAGKMNQAAAINIEKYFWQAGVSSYEEGMIKAANFGTLDYRLISCPCLFLVGENEADELKRQSDEIYDYLKDKTEATLKIFTAQEGADTHCQVNNLRLSQQTIFDWLDDTTANIALPGRLG